ncbi:uncharacterized protein si:ch211-13f8.1 [Thalassophryne amazonica]|uniref:uncharacterized protein si:ch211-13f8.1 n=1 Tax=Thalassophryne amazonica TaxID=390379 RepID=UPI0014718DA3|nr:uncharacterized protein si:ch211-13f8.1 [Thalassophryne amazonica]
MEEEKVVEISQGKSGPVISPSPAGFPINWELITGPVPQPVLPTSSLGPSFPPPQSSAMHTLQTKVKPLTQRRPRGREKDRDRVDSEVPMSCPFGQISSEVLLQQRPRGKGPVSLCVPAWQPGPTKNLSSSEEEEEVEVQVKLEIHSPPAEVQVEPLDSEKSHEDHAGFQTSHPCGLRAGISLESFLSDNSCSSKDDLSSPPSPALYTSAISSVSTATYVSSSSSSRHWAPPKGFWRVARPEMLLLNGVGPYSVLPALPLKDYTQMQKLAEPQKKKPSEAGFRRDERYVMGDNSRSSKGKDSDMEKFYHNGVEHKETDPVKEQCSSDEWNSTSSPSGALSVEEKLKLKQRAYAKLRERQQKSQEEREQSGTENASSYGDKTCRVDSNSAHGAFDKSESAVLSQDLESRLSLSAQLGITDELPLSPRHEEAKRLLERARLKARSNHSKGSRPCRRAHSDQRCTEKQEADPSDPTLVQKTVQTKEAAQTGSGPLLIPTQRDTSPGEEGGRSRWFGCSPTRVRFEDESEKEAETRYLDRVRQRSRPGNPKSKMKESNTDSNSSGSEKSRSHKSVSTPLSQKQEDSGVNSKSTTVIKEIIVLVKKCETCGSIVREPQPVTSLSEPQSAEPQQSSNPDDQRGKVAPRCGPSNKPEVSTRPKAPLTVTFAGAYVLGKDKECSTGWKTSGFGKLRRRSRKGESRLESGHGPYGPSWAQRRNSNPRNRVNLSRTVSFAPGSPISLEPSLLMASGGLKESPTPSLPIKSALKSSLRNRTAAAQPSVQYQTTSNQGSDIGFQHSALLDVPESRRESPVSSAQGTPTTSNPATCIRPSTLRYSPARLTPDLPAVELWDGTPDGVGLSGEVDPGSEGRPLLRGLSVSRADDLRAELLRAEHLKAEAIWEENCDDSRKPLTERDGRPKLFLRRFFSSIGLNSVGRLVKGGRSSSMEQLSLPTGSRTTLSSPNLTRKPQPTICIQRTPSLQTLHTVLPLAQLRKASSVQSLERRTERSTMLGEVQMPFGLVSSLDIPQHELHKTLSVEDVLPSRMMRPVGHVTQAFPDGTLMLDLFRPPNGPFGFVISRGKGRPDIGVYVEKVGDGSSEGPYVGLLGVGDEILQVNGEAVAGLSLDHVTRLMTRESTVSLRIMPARSNQR